MRQNKTYIAQVFSGVNVMQWSVLLEQTNCQTSEKGNGSSRLLNADDDFPRHYNDVIMSAIALHDFLLNRLFKAQIKENIKVPRYWPLCGEFTGDRWIPRTNSQ